jgi:hypothetical protein
MVSKVAMMTLIGGIIIAAAIGAVVAITMSSSGSSSGSAHGDTGDKILNNNINGQNVTEGKKYTVGLNENLGLKERS